MLKNSLSFRILNTAYASLRRSSRRRAVNPLFIQLYELCYIVFYWDGYKKKGLRKSPLKINKNL
jgi:hypothetical protein